MKCKIIFERDPKTLKVTDKIKAVKAPNGQKSILFDDIRSQVVDDKLSLETYYKTYTDEFKDKVKGVGKDKNDEVIFEEVKDIILPSNLLNKSVIKESDRIIWGHPALGKTTALESNPNLFIDWDVEFNSKRDKWIEDKSGTIKGTPEYKKARNEYLINYEKYPEYIEFVTNEWNKAKQKAKQENKKLLASPHMLLNLFPNDFDKIINISDDVFMERAVKRSGGDEINSRLWKEGINKTLENVDKSKVITTDKYLSDLLPSRMLASVGDDVVERINKLIDSYTEEEYTQGSFRYFTPEGAFFKNYGEDINWNRTIKENTTYGFRKRMGDGRSGQQGSIESINKEGYYKFFRDIESQIKEILILSNSNLDKSEINNIIDLIKTNDPDNIELAKQLIKGIIENRGLYSSSDVKSGVDYVFETNPELAKIGSKQEYSDYLDSIFPDSKVKEVVYHGSPVEGLSTLTDEFSNNTGVAFTNDLQYAKDVPIKHKGVSGTVYSSIINLKNPYPVDDRLELSEMQGRELNKVDNYAYKLKSNKEADGLILLNSDDDLANNFINEYVIFEPSQIHILGSTKDIAQFTHYIKTRKASTSSGIQSNNIRSKYFSTGDTQSHRDILQKIVDTDKNFGPLAKRMLEINSNNIPITLKPVTSLFEFIDDNGKKGSAAGVYYPDRKKIEIAEFSNMRQDGVPLLLHELLHGFSFYEIKMNTKNTQELREIYKEVLKYKSSITNKYRISNLDEFIVGIFTDSQFMKELQQIPSIYPERHQSIWEDVLQWFKNLLKTNSKEASLLDDAFYVATKIIMDHSNNTKEQEEYVWTDDEGNPLASPSDPADTQIEDQFKLRNEDGSRKRYTENKALELARKLNKANPDRPFKFTVIKIMGEKGDNRVYHAVKVVPREDKLFSLSDYKGQPQITQPDSIKLDIDAFQAMVGPDGYSTDQMAIMEVYNRNTEGMMVEKKDVLVSDLPDKKLRETYEKKGVKVVKRYKTKDGYILYRVSDRQDMIKVAGLTAEKAQEQENNPKSVLARQRGTEMHDLNQRILEMLANSNNPAFGIDVYRQLDFNMWFGDGVTPGAFEAFKQSDEYKQLQKEGKDIFDNRSDSDQFGDTYKISDSTKQVDKLVKSMMRLYHQVHLIQKDINVKNNTNHKPIFLTETVLVDKGANEAGTMDIAVIFSDGTASIYDHKFTDLQAVQFSYPKDKAKQDWAEIKRIRTAQGLPVNDTYIDSQAWYYTLPDHIDLYKREDSWNAQIGRYSEMLTKLYGVKSIRQARILPVATSYTKIDKEFTPESKVAVILTGDDDFGISQIALEVEKTGDVALDRFIQMLLANKHALAKERLEKKAYDDPKYNDRIRKLDASIQALLLSRDVTKIADSIQALADQIQLDLNNVDVPISFTDIINHLKEIEMYESFISATAGELDAMKEKYSEQIKKNEVNPYSTFIQRLGVAKSELGLAAKSMHDKMTSMIYEENAKGNFMSSALFKSFEKQVDMSEMGKFFTHLREVNHPIVSLFSQLLDKVATNRLNERRDLEVKINELNKELSKWGERKGLKGPAVYKSILDDKLNLIHKFKHYVKEDFKDHLDQKNHKDNIKWFKENFHRTGANEEKFQARLKLEKESINKTAKSEQEKYERLEKWLDTNDVNHKDGDNKAWYNQYVQYWLTPLDPEEYYTDQYKELLKPENTPLLDFYDFYTNHMVELSKKVDFKVSETMVAEIRKDTIDTMVQDGIFAGWKQQGHNMFNYFSKYDKDDGFQTIDDGTKNGKKVPIFFTDSVGVENKSFDLAKSLMIYSDFVNNYSGVKDMEHAALAMRELVSKTRGVKTNWKGQVGRNAAGEIDLKEGPNEKLLEAFDKWINYYIYGETKEGDPFQNKVVDAMTSISSRKSVALNFLSAVGGHVNAAAQLDMIASKAFQFDDKILKAGRKEAERFKLFRETMGKGKDATEALDSKSMFANFFFEIQQDDLSYEKANSVSLSTMRKAMSKDYAFILQRWSDHVIDSTTLNAMLMSYGVDPNTGKTYPIKRLKEMYANDPKYKDLEWKSLWDSLDLENKDKDGNKHPIFINQHDGTKMSDATYTDFRRKAKHLISKAKGNMSSEDIAGYRTHMIGRLVMQFRGWIPATVRERVKGEQYSLTMEQFEVGRWIAAYEMVGKNLKRTAGEFIKQMLPFVKADFNKNMNDPLHPMKVKYEQYIADNPHLKPDPLNPAPEHITYEQYYNTYVGEVKALAQEVQMYLALAGFLGLMMFAAGDDELKENPLLRLATALTNRVMLEIGFYTPVIGAAEQYNLLVRQPVSSLSLLADASKAVTNTFTEMYDTIMGADWNKTVTPRFGDDSWELDYSSRPDSATWWYYSHQFIPPVKFMFDVLEPLNISERVDTGYDYLLDNSKMVYRY